MLKTQGIRRAPLIRCVNERLRQAKKDRGRWHWYEQALDTAL